MQNPWKPMLKTKNISQRLRMSRYTGKIILIPVFGVSWRMIDTQLDKKGLQNLVHSSVIAKEKTCIIKEFFFDMAPPFTEATNDVDNLLMWQLNKKMAKTLFNEVFLENDFVLEIWIVTPKQEWNQIQN